MYLINLRVVNYPLGNITVSLVYLWMNRVRNYRGRVSNFNQSEARKHCFLASDWSKFEYTNFRKLNLLGGCQAEDALSTMWFALKMNSIRYEKTFRLLYMFAFLQCLCIFFMFNNSLALLNLNLSSIQ